MIYYELKIESSSETIEINEDNAIDYAEVVLDTHDNSTQKKSSSLLARMTIQGNITSSINDSLIKISQWARDLKKETTYRKVTLVIKEDKAGVILRTYEIPDMFVCDYSEIYHTPKEGTDSEPFQFVLSLNQRENKLEEFNTY